MTTKTKLTDLLTQRLELWDKVDAAYEEGLIAKAIDLTKLIEQELTPKIREVYGL